MGDDKIFGVVTAVDGTQCQIEGMDGETYIGHHAESPTIDSVEEGCPVRFVPGEGRLARNITIWFGLPIREAAAIMDMDGSSGGNV